MEVELGQTFELKLPVQLGWGGRWMLRSAVPPCIRIVSDKIEPSAAPLEEGGTQNQLFDFEAIAVGEGELVFENRRVFQPEEKPIEVRKYKVVVRAKR